MKDNLFLLIFFSKLLPDSDVINMVHDRQFKTLMGNFTLRLISYAFRNKNNQIKNKLLNSHY